MNRTKCEFFKIVKELFLGHFVLNYYLLDKSNTISSFNYLITLKSGVYSISMQSKRFHYKVKRVFFGYKSLMNHASVASFFAEPIFSSLKINTRENTQTISMEFVMQFAAYEATLSFRRSCRILQ